MNEPIKAGDLCEVIDGLQGRNSPNLGLVVRVSRYVADHTKFGRIFRCKAEYATIGYAGSKNPDLLPGEADFAQSWLKKLPPETPPVKAKEIANHE